MARLSDFQQVPDGRIPLDPKLISHNAFDSGNSVDWELTEIARPLGGELGSDPFDDAEREVKRSVATDQERGRSQRLLHAALDRLMSEDDEEQAASDGRVRLGKRLYAALDALMDAVGKKPTPAAVVVAKDRSIARDSQRSQGGGCGRSYACDTGWLP